MDAFLVLAGLGGAVAQAVGVAIHDGIPSRTLELHYTGVAALLGYIDQALGLA